MISHALADSWKRNHPGTHTKQWSATRFNPVLYFIANTEWISMWYYANVKLWMYPTIYLQAISGSGHYPHQVLQMLLILLSHKSLQLLHTLPITPAQYCVSQLLTPPAHSCPGTGITSSSSTDGLGAAPVLLPLLPNFLVRMLTMTLPDLVTAPGTRARCLPQPFGVI